VTITNSERTKWRGLGGGREKRIEGDEGSLAR